MLRSRDIVALIAAVILFRRAWNDPMDESLTSTAHLAFYMPRQHVGGRLAVAPAVLDVDGDGSAEALAVVLQNPKSDWVVQILDLKPAALTDKTHVAPFAPKVLYESQPLQEGKASPLFTTTGQVMMNKGKEETPNTDPSQSDDRTHRYFCGTDWHDAATKCAKHCPSGQATDCPDGESCFADTPCDAQAKKKEKTIETNLYLTPAGGLPSIVTLWSDGMVTLHSLTGDMDDSKKKKRPERQLELRLMWQKQSLSNRTALEWEDVSVTFVDGIDAGNRHGMILVTGYIDYSTADQKEEEDVDVETSPFIAAMNAKTGEILWESWTEEEAHQAEVPLPVASRGTTSIARRRSMIPSLHPNAKVHGEAMANCMHAYRRSLLVSDALPFIYWSEEDASVKALHFDHSQHAKQQQKKKKAGHKVAPKSPKKFGDTKANGWRSGLLPSRKSKQRMQPQKGQPNVVVLHNQLGMEVRSLKNGRSLCHLSLWTETLYTDLNHDGVLDSIQIVTGDHEPPEADEKLDDQYKFTAELVKRVANLDEKVSLKEALEQQVKRTSLCHAMALSGVPNKEELFSANLCGRESTHPSVALEGAPPLAVEGTRKGKDVIMAVNNGMVHRYRGSTGRRQWQLVGKHYEDFPTWDDGSIVALSRIEAENVLPSNRPIVLAGENSLAILSPKKGRVLSTAIFPQPSSRRPVLIDFTGDGTTDVLVITTDAIWGYQVVVRTGASIFFRIVVGLLLVGMMLALLRNQFGPQPGKRSTDA